MALIVEDGSGLPNAESYCSVTYADTYHGNRGNAAWVALGTPVKEQLLRIATDFMVATFRGGWKGTRYVPAQNLDWPRYNVFRDSADVMPFYSLVPYNIVPDEVAQSCAEFAWAQNSTPLLTSIKRGKKNVKVGPLEIEYDGASDVQTFFVLAARRLGPLLAGGGSPGMVRLVRS